MGAAALFSSKTRPPPLINVTKSATDRNKQQPRSKEINCTKRTLIAISRVTPQSIAMCNGEGEECSIRVRMLQHYS